MRLNILLSFTLAVTANAGKFNCPTYAAPPPPKTIADLNPAHVGVVMAMGDSITAAFAARSGLKEGRDISWSIGVGEADQLTLPYMLSQYSPKLVGASTKAVLPKDITHLPSHDYHPKTDHLNVAESEGAVHRGSLDEQWGYLQQSIPQFSSFNSSWKVLTVWMTANDVCGKCDGPVEADYLDAWASKTNELLFNVSQTMSKVYVNLVSTLDLSNVHRLQQSKIGCKIEHGVILEECGCIDRGNATELAQLDDNVHTMNNKLHALASQWHDKLAQQQRTDMAVVVQSFQEGVGKTLDITFLNKLDCFHPSTVGHELLAIGLWNSMLCVDGRQQRCGEHFSKDLPPTCPTNSSVFYTGPDVIPGPPQVRV